MERSFLQEEYPSLLAMSSCSPGKTFFTSDGVVSPVGDPSRKMDAPFGMELTEKTPV